MLRELLARRLFGRNTESIKQQIIRDLKLEIVVGQSRANVLEMVSNLRDSEIRRKALLHSKAFRSQRGQDVFALMANGFGLNRFYVEVGAAHGEVLSNTWMLEEAFKWDGLLIEPSPQWDDSLALRTGRRDSRAVTGWGGRRALSLRWTVFPPQFLLRNWRVWSNLSLEWFGVTRRLWGNY